MKYFKLIRYQNLLLLAFMQLLFRYGFLKFQNIFLSLNDWQYGLLVLATVLIAAAGYIINDILDQETDYDNKKENIIVGKSLSEKAAYNFYFVLNITGVGIGYYLASVIHKPSFAGAFIIISATLYMYATSLKQMLLIGNIIVALLLSFSVIIIGLFDLLPATYDGNQAEMGVMFSILIDYAVFAFIINLIREIVKDMEDVEGDYNNGMSTLPIAIGNEKTSKIVGVLGIIATLILLWYINSNLMSSKLYYAVIYGLLFIVAPMIFFVVKILNAKTKEDFHLLSVILKWIIFFGILSILAINLNIMQNVK
ncbi:geranylgeranylglycerol-phosphate geranylgeranyltransferase [Flavobacterium paronense]|uniref:Geranylgeranylglycerol-phosphate geranylgeranyltransferase n=1 Tax=Flavobacterium paronense TaxID=1392775 RepID=A0ABV5GG80_9FLAO|nr:geranylgeranylglycerol-phosphate geranylgeranyltransferase [Flavobacterium paronense]MDN3677026.1 geranylgeranylglycerol-phosphate geranylgeranyltransferase [Flavobacterium paronense]